MLAVGVGVDAVVDVRNWKWLHMLDEIYFDD